MTDLRDLEKRTKAVYERHAIAFDRRRAKHLFERRWLARFTQSLNDGDRILDLGCGSGEPIAHYLISNGFRVTGVDFSSPMLEIAKRRFPDHHWHLCDMRSLALPEVFDGIIGWNSFFHLPRSAQREVLGKLSQHLKVGGPLMLTVGPSHGETVGYVNGEAVYHASLSPQEYDIALAERGLSLVEFVPEDTDCNRHTVLLAKKGD